MKPTEKRLRRLARARRTRARAQVSAHPRLVVYRSLRAVYAQILDPSTGVVVCGTSSLKAKKLGVEGAKEVGKAIADLAKKKKIEAVAFDRNGYRYHGQVKALAEAAREAGLNF